MSAMLCLLSSAVALYEPQTLSSTRHAATGVGGSEGMLQQLSQVVVLVVLRVVFAW